MIRVIGFDLDDTLWDVGPVIFRAEKKLNEWLSCEVPQLLFDVVGMRGLREQVLEKNPALIKQITELRRSVIERAMLLSKIERHRANTLSHNAIEIFLQARNQIELFDGAETMLSALASKYTLCALTNGNADINRLGLDHIFSFAFSAEQVGAPKPAANLFTRALQHSHSEPAEMIYIGDDPVLDVDAAKKLGMHAIWMNRGTKQPGKFEADEIVSNISELPDAVSRIDTSNV